VRIGAGSFAGGVTITRDVTIRGAGAAATSITGGGPVVTIGSDTTSPRVSIRGVTITGGLATGNPHGDLCAPDVPVCGPGYAAATARGGGIEAFAGSKVYLDLWVKVLANWRKNPGSLSRFGYQLATGKSK
jgi:hypothetical protein